MIAALLRWLHRDTAVDRRDRRITALESELAALRMDVATGRDVYLRRLERCRGCATCNPEPTFADLPDYEFGDPE
jgi:hypothetical protein